LEKELRELQEAKAHLDVKQRELEELMHRLRAEREMEASERERLTEEISRREAEVEMIRREVQEKDEHARRLQDEVEESRRKHEEVEELRRKHEEVEESRRRHEVEESRRRHEVEESRRKHEEAMERMLAMSKEPVKHEHHNNYFDLQEKEHVSAMPKETAHYERHNNDFDLENSYYTSNGNTEEMESHVFSTDDDFVNVPQPELEKEPAIEQNVDMKKKMEELRSDLSNSRIESRKTAADVQYDRLSAVGQTKYKTLTQIRQGSAKRRIDQFENM